MKKLLLSLFLLSYSQFASCGLVDEITTYEIYLLKRLDDCDAEMKKIYYTKGKDDPLYVYLSGRQDAYYDALFHTKNPDWINLKNPNDDQDFYIYRMNRLPH